MSDLPTAVNLKDFNYTDYYKSERNIIEPQLKVLGYTDIRFSDGERDSFGPLTRIVSAKNVNGESVRFIYG